MRTLEEIRYLINLDGYLVRKIDGRIIDAVIE